MVASEALRNQVAAKWQDSFNRLNRGAVGIFGLMEFSKVRGSLSSFLNGATRSKKGPRAHALGLGRCC
jgi:hypothetical protein